MTNKGIIIMILYVIGITILLFACQASINRIEHAECLRWENEKQEFQNVDWYPTSSQKEQCLRYDIEL